MIAAISSLDGRFVRFALALAGAMILSACEAGASHYAGGARSPGGTAPRFVSLNPCTDAILAEVADADQILALSHYSADPQSSSISPAIASRFAVTGGTVEEVAMLDPDMVLAGGFLAPATHRALERMGFAIATFGIAGDVETSLAQVRRIAALTGHPGRGERLVARIEASLAALDAARVENGARSVVLWQPGQIVPGKQTLVAHMIRRAGLTNHSAELGLGQADYLSLEQLLADPPDVLLVAGREEGQRHHVLNQLTDTRVESFDPALLYCAGPTIIRAAERLRAIRQAGA